MYDAIIIGGGPAGLQAALTLGRMHRRTLLLDSRDYRNGTVRHAHNLLTNDGRDPAELRRLGREEIAAYPDVQIRDAAVSAVARETDALTVAVGDEILRAHAIILATGVADRLPDIPGLAEQWGDRVANCPFCHGHEFAGRPVAIVNGSAHAAALGRMLEPVASEVHLVDPAEVVRVAGTTDGLALERTDGSVLEVAGAFVAPTWSSRADSVEGLGVELQESGAVRTDPFGRTSIENVYAVGDLAHPDHLPGPLFSLAAAIAGGQLAAVAIVQSLVMD
ncbi:NAD(P)/FAD-dependent oxidoreductase [Microbacterium sp. BH-3-3-3]|uniref:NAD(P)/FAD-dependent oxidoreductase n=1 Tax=Microbacterium sp. BH-3-3-3 TaxID=1906742 RepID=UPI0011AAD3EE|nr:NAD(P)/FAD-dependent oxidoreductase [Microbacterium sp. BH-3-3-3]